MQIIDNVADLQGDSHAQQVHDQQGHRPQDQGAAIGA